MKVEKGVKRRKGLAYIPGESDGRGTVGGSEGGKEGGGCY